MSDGKYIITEQGDMGLGAERISAEDEALLKRQEEAARKREQEKQN